jgi:hypothetical protein
MNHQSLSYRYRIEISLDTLSSLNSLLTHQIALTVQPPVQIRIDLVAKSSGRISLYKFRCGLILARRLAVTVVKLEQSLCRKLADFPRGCPRGCQPGPNTSRRLKVVKANHRKRIWWRMTRDMQGLQNAGRHLIIGGKYRRRRRRQIE